MIAQLNTIAQLWWEWMGGMFWQVSLLIILVAGIDMAIRRWAWPQVRYVLWGLIFIKLIIPPTWQMPTSVISWIQPLIEKRVSIQIEPQEEITGVSLEMESDALALPRVGNADLSGKISFKSSLLLGWIVGMAAFGFILIRKMFQLNRWYRRQDADREIPNWFRALLKETAMRLKLKKSPVVLFSKETLSPAVYGLFRPVLLLPEEFFNRLSRDEAEHVLIHELCHLKRGDLWVHWFCLVLQMVYWFNPLLIWTRRRMRYICEICCDLSVADILREKTRYYRETLIRTARDLFTETVEPGLGLLGVFEEPFRIVPRLQWLEKKTWENRKRKTASILFTSLIMIVCIMPMAGLSQSRVSEEGYDSNAVETSDRVSKPAQEALVESRRRMEQNPDDIASARQPLIDYMSTYSPDMVPMVMYQMLGQLWYSDKEAVNHVEEAGKIYEAGYESYPEDEMLLLNYAVTMYESENFLDAAPLFEEYYDVSLKQEVKYLSYAAASYYAAGNRADAKRIFMKMLEVSQTPDPKWLISLIDICSETGALDEAEQYKAQLADLNSRFSEKSDIVYTLDDIEEPPRLLRAFPPKYPDVAKEEKIGGKVLVELVVTKDGTPKDPWVIDAEPPDIFEEAALEAVRRYRFAPGRRNGESVDVKVKLPISFILDEPVEEFQIDTEAKDREGIKYEMSEVDRPPRVLRVFPPKYPFIAKEEKIEGKVLLRIVIDTEGKAQEPEVVMAVPYGVFEESALEVVKLYQFEPSLMNGMPVACIVKVPIVYSLGNENNPPALFPEGVPSFNFNNSGIKEFVKFVGDMTGKRFVINDDVKGEVTVLSQSIISIDELVKIYESVLDLNGLEAVPSGESLRIKRKGF